MTLKKMLFAILVFTVFNQWSCHSVTAIYPGHGVTGQLATGPLTKRVLKCTQEEGDSDSLKRFAFSSQEMGVELNIVVYCKDASEAETVIEKAVNSIKGCNAIFSDYDETSEISRLFVSRQEDETFVEMSDSLRGLMDRAGAYSGDTNGAFDVTLGSLTRLWRQVRKNKKMVEATVFSGALATCGFNKLQFDQSGKRVRVPAGLRFDFGGIAKGYAADLALNEMAEFGCPAAFVDLGGDIAIGDSPPNKEGWRVEIAPLEKGDAKTRRFINVSNTGLATSGDTEQFVEIDGVRYSHILDPKTGLGMRRRASVTVWAANATEADAMASAYSVMDRQSTVDHVATRASIEILIQENVDGSIEEVQSVNFPMIHDLK